MADSGVITTPEAALERIMAVETPIRPSKLTGVAGVLPTVVTVVLTLLVLFALSSVAWAWFEIYSRQPGMYR
jgi:hypothetical protein